MLLPFLLSLIQTDSIHINMTEHMAQQTERRASTIDRCIFQKHEHKGDDHIILLHNFPYRSSSASLSEHYRRTMYSNPTSESNPMFWFVTSCNSSYAAHQDIERERYREREREGERPRDRESRQKDAHPIIVIAVVVVIVAVAVVAVVVVIVAVAVVAVVVVIVAVAVVAVVAVGWFF
jgi:hypothetical protein